MGAADHNIISPCFSHPPYFFHSEKYTRHVFVNNVGRPVSDLLLVTSFEAELLKMAAELQKGLHQILAKVDGLYGIILSDRDGVTILKAHVDPPPSSPHRLALLFPNPFSGSTSSPPLAPPRSKPPSSDGSK
ncbi:Ragulator complex protein LAMTOR3-A [Orchesella cincta]|uniref:Ragulator complex protein LAMTOR3-A n=1 Tax=Orchesella cincta TaxID=48709 RepID=A0A1D2MBW1_ORCCI|nr:Ragulator complex protein LAMTOR3-A [Orchesella cincta]